MKSFKESIINIKKEVEVSSTEINELSKKFNISPIISKILINRGVRSEKEFKDFLKPTLKESLPNPKDIKNIDGATDLIVNSIKNKKTITLYTDFDVDGLTSGSQLFNYIKNHGGLVNRYTPNRFNEGYGLNDEAINKLIKSKTELLVCLDCGTSSVEEITKAKKYGMEVVVIDHHKLPEQLPPADYIVNPADEECAFNKYQLCTAGLVWMLIIVLARKFKEDLKLEEVESPKKYIDLAAVGTICDMVPLVSLNRLITIRGLEILEKTQNVGLIELMRVSKVKPKIKASCISFGIGPRINAAGRMEEGKQVIDLLTTSSKNEAETICKKIERLNSKRKNLESKIRNNTIKEVEKLENDNNSIVYYHEDNHLGVVGIVAQRLVEIYNKPSAVIGNSPTDNKVVKGSIRGVDGMHIAEFLHNCSDILISGGGHAKAGGFSLLKENLDEFTTRFYNNANEKLSLDDLKPRVKADCKINFSNISLELVNQINNLSPFGIGNPNPVFYTEEVSIKSVTTIGVNHLKLILSKDKDVVSAVAWGQKGNPLLKSNNIVNLAYNVDINDYKGVSSVQLNIKGVQDC